MNLPMTGAVFAVVVLFMDLKVPEGTIRENLGRMDWCAVRLLWGAHGFGFV
jgi:hypothetical protein